VPGWSVFDSKPNESRKPTASVDRLRQKKVYLSEKISAMKESASFFLTALCLLFLTNCKQADKPQPQGDRLGDLHFDFTGAAEAMPAFTKGLKLLHNFEFDDAATAFREAQTLDSTFAMAYWGEAMTYNHPLWRQQDKEKALAALNRLAPSAEARREKAKTSLEKDFLQSLEILYGEGTKNERDSAYSQFLEKMYATYPGNEEVAAFYALSILGAVPVGRNDEAYGKCASVVGGILKENPNHPGALHYLIHSYDDPYHAKLALDAAHSYSKVAADATHALHMPSHIFLAVGMWDEVIECNIASWEASVRRMQEKKLGIDAQSYHAFSWLMYGYLQKANFKEASRMVAEMKKYVDESPSENARDYFVGMKGAYLMHTGDWNSDIAAMETKTEDLGIVARSQWAFTEGMKAFVKKDAGTLSRIIRDMEAARKKTANLVTAKGLPMCSGASPAKAPNQLDVDWANVMEMELRAQLADLQGSRADAEKWFKAAIELEGNISYDFGPPAILKPSHEMYGEWLLAQNRPEEALAQFNVTLERNPKRYLALNGKEKAAGRT
jgi:tetratricopeptide (TPR) repeat protein